MESSYSEASCSESQSVASCRRSGKVEGGQQWSEGAWTLQERLRYVIYIHHNRQSLNSKLQRRASKVFKQMSQFILTRNPSQCRSQNQKMYRRFKTINKIVSLFRAEYGPAAFEAAYAELSSDPLIRFVTEGETKSSSATGESQEVGREMASCSTQTEGAVVVMSSAEMQQWEMFRYMLLVQSCTAPQPFFFNGELRL